MAPDVAWLPRSLGIQFTAPDQKKRRKRPLPFRVRTYSFAGIRSPGFDENRDGVHARNKSVSVEAPLADLNPSIAEAMMEDDDQDELSDIESVRTSLDSTMCRTDSSSVAGSPGTNMTSNASDRSSIDVGGPELLTYDFSKIDYELEKAKVLGQGLWSTVYMAEQKSTSRGHRRNASSQSSISSQRSPRIRKQRGVSAAGLFAVKTPVRPDAKHIFHQEARILTHLQRRSTATHHIVPFLGYDPRNSSLVFSASIGGSLESLTNRLKQLTEISRHLELISTFPGIAYDLISGLDFLHANNVVHADIKPANILLDVMEHATAHKPIIRARYIDFSASFIPAHPEFSVSQAGGTWDFLAPEQLSILRHPDQSIPSFASDVWSLGITLLFVIVGQSPYTAACGGNMFMLREAIKTGDPLQFARMDPVARKRLAAAQEFVDCCRQGLKKDREKRVTAKGWVAWAEQSGT